LNESYTTISALLLVFTHLDARERPLKFRHCILATISKNVVEIILYKND
jgi:hypothetical protein